MIINEGCNLENFVNYVDMQENYAFNIYFKQNNIHNSVTNAKYAYIYKN